MRWEWKNFGDLSAGELYAALRLRSEVFVVEQNCVYQDCDGHDPHCRHLLGWRDGGTGPELVAYLRLVPAGRKYEEASIGRVVTSRLVRGSGAGKALIDEALRFVAEDGNYSLRISAQKYLERFYAGYGFVSVGDEYLEDDIPHIEMFRAGGRA